MKKSLMLILFVCIAVYVGTAKPVDIATAKMVATHFWKHNCATKNGIQTPNFIDITPEEYAGLYILSNEMGGFVIVAADDRVSPILGYSEKAICRNEELPENIKFWLGMYAEQISVAISKNWEASEETEKKWRDLREDRFSNFKDMQVVDPLVSTQWDQSRPFYFKCPTVSGSRCLVGCTATAMGQIMKFWNYPEHGLGSRTYTCSNSESGGYNGTLSVDFSSATYNWSAMENTYSYYASSSSASVVAVATLLYHCGVSVEMHYGTQASGAQVAVQGWFDYPSAWNALVNHFGYYASARFKSNMTDDAWISMLKTELDAGRPILYSGSKSDGTDGHAFVCDGYTSNNYFHFNWGWSGSYDGNFLVSALTPGSGGWGGYNQNDFSYYQDVIIGIRPADYLPDQYEVNNDFDNAASLATTFQSNITTSGSNFHNASDEDYYKITLPTGTRYTVLPTLYDVNYPLSGQNLTVDAVMHYSRNGNTWLPSTAIDDVGNNITMSNGGNLYFHVEPKVEASLGSYVLKLQVSISSGIHDGENTETWMICPNPVTDVLTIFAEQELQVFSASIVNLQGQQVKQLMSIGENQQIDVSDIAAGVYFLRMKTQNGIFVQKFIKK